MYKQALFPIFIAAAMTLLLGCNAKQTPDQILKDDSQRMGLITIMAHQEPYMTQMMNEMMKSDSCKMMMAHSMMNDSSMHTMMMDNMMTMCKNDPAMCKMMMDKTMAMCEADSSKCKMMMESMKDHPNMMKMMKGMGDMKMGDMKMDKMGKMKK